MDEQMDRMAEIREQVSMVFLRLTRKALETLKFGKEIFSLCIIMRRVVARYVEQRRCCQTNKINGFRG